MWSGSGSLGPSGRASIILDIASLFDGEEMAFLYSPGCEEGEVKSLLCLFPEEVLRVESLKDLEALKGFVSSSDFPVVGYFSYELGKLTVPYRFNSKKHLLPYASLRRFRVYVEENLSTGELRFFGDKRAVDEVRGFVERGLLKEKGFSVGGALSSSMDRDEYIEKVKRTVEYIKDGEVYQLNLSIAFSVPFSGSSLSLFKHFARMEPASFYAYIKDGDCEIVSTSPERFIRVLDGSVLSQPIKGTRRFETSPDEMMEELLCSEKEDAELSMIVDLIRNDISKHCVPGSVDVPRHKAVKVVGKLLQMYSDVTGRLSEGSTPLELFLDAFPGGSITGCPKIRAMEIIDELEPHSRDVYCGSVAVFFGDRCMDSSIAIRTAFVKEGVMYFYAGSGIVADSIPEMEYEETISKAEKFLRLCGGFF